jgi:APA family basic amino acid/polyamine antiporter
MSNLWRRKPIDKLLSDGSGEHGATLKKTLGPVNLVALGIGAIIGAGLFSRTAAAAAYHAGPAVTIGFIVAAVGCAFAGLCYAEFASMIPIAGSAYTYSYATMGELVAWIIGWDLVLEYAVGAATVAIVWSQYANNVLEWAIGWHVPYEWCHSPFESMNGVNGIMNVPALFILLALTLLLIRGMKESAIVNGIIVVTKVTIVIIIIALAWRYIDPANHTPYIPDDADVTDQKTGVTYHYGGILGILGAAGVVFFAFIGFDAVSTAAQETKNPKRDMPIGILGSLAICTVLYVLFSHVLTGLASPEEFRNEGRESSVAWAITHHMPPSYNWLSNLVSVAILAGFSSVILVMLYGQSRVFFSMSRDGLVPRVFSAVHPKFHTPWKSNLVFLGFVGVFAAFIPEDVVGDMTSIGTLFAFVLVSLGVWVLRARHPELPRAFKTPLVPLVPILGILVNLAMIFGLGWTNWARLGVWLVIGLAIYFGYSRHRSQLASEK